MTTAQVLFEQYKVLPPHVKQQYKRLIMKEKLAPAPAETDEDDENESGGTIRISRKALLESVRQVKLLKAGKAQTMPVEVMLAELDAELAAEDAAKREKRKSARRTSRVIA